MTEVWKNISDYEGVYQVSNMGRIKSLRRLDSIGKSRKERLLISIPNAEGYIRTELNKNGKRHMFSTHRLVAKAFLANPTNKPQINHLDGNKQNNLLSNLEWCSPSENIIHAHKNGLSKPVKGEQVGTHKLSEKEAKEIRNLKGKGLSQIVIGKMFNISHSTVGRIQNNKCWVNI
jgi:DNA-directed RNA polymerase specialized sigma subunit